MNSKLAYTFFKRRFLILVHTKDAPEDAEWKEYVAAARGWRKDIQAFLVVSEGGVPDDAAVAAAMRRLHPDAVSDGVHS